MRVDLGYTDLMSTSDFSADKPTRTRSGKLTKMNHFLIEIDFFLKKFAIELRGDDTKRVEATEKNST